MIGRIFENGMFSEEKFNNNSKFSNETMPIYKTFFFKTKHAVNYVNHHGVVSWYRERN